MTRKDKIVIFLLIAATIYLIYNSIKYKLEESARLAAYKNLPAEADFLVGEIVKKGCVDLVRIDVVKEVHIQGDWIRIFIKRGFDHSCIYSLFPSNKWKGIRVEFIEV